MKGKIVSALLAIVLGLAACGEEIIPATSGSEPTSNLGGDGLPVQQPGEAYGHQPVALTGVFALQDDGCWTVDLGDGPRLVVFPPGYAKDPDDGALMLGPDGVVVQNAMDVDAVGGVVSIARFPGIPDGFWGNYLAFCEPEARELLVLDAIEPAFRPDELGDAELVAILQDADLTVAWGCGIGFAVSTEDQHVALVIHLRDVSNNVEAPVSLPNDSWIAEVVIGKLLMAQWCDDAIESWEPHAVVAARWPLSGGELDFTPPVTTGCSAGAPVAASLSGIRVQAPTGELELGNVTMVNDAYGCFAG